MRTYRIRNVTRNAELASQALLAETSKERRTGLLKRDGLNSGEALWIVPCEAVHTFGMKFPIDVLFLDRKKRIVKIRREMPKSRISGCLRAHSVLEMSAGAAEAAGAQVGDQLEFELVATAESPNAVTAGRRD